MSALPLIASIARARKMITINDEPSRKLLMKLLMDRNCHRPGKINFDNIT
jgi:hypothetical protein